MIYDSIFTLWIPQCFPCGHRVPGHSVLPSGNCPEFGQDNTTFLPSSPTLKCDHCHKRAPEESFDIEEWCWLCEILTLRAVTESIAWVIIGSDVVFGHRALLYGSLHFIKERGKAKLLKH